MNGARRTTQGDDTEFLSAECAVGERAGYEALHGKCRQTEDIPMPHGRGLLVIAALPVLLPHRGGSAMNSPVEQSSWTPERPYVSGRCTIGTHDRCRDAEPRDSGVPGVRYLVCTCSCHRLSPALVKGAST